MPLTKEGMQIIFLNEKLGSSSMALSILGGKKRKNLTCEKFLSFQKTTVLLSVKQGDQWLPNQQMVHTKPFEHHLFVGKSHWACLLFKTVWPPLTLSIPSHVQRLL
jgi:hypothetical protein